MCVCVVCGVYVCVVCCVYVYYVSVVSVVVLLEAGSHTIGQVGLECCSP